MANKTAHVYADTSTIVLVSVLCDVYVNYDRTCRAFTMWYSRVSGSLQFLSCERFACVILILIQLASKWMHLATLGRHTCLHSRAAATAAAFPDFLQVFLTVGYLSLLVAGPLLYFAISNAVVCAGDQYMCEPVKSSFPEYILQVLFACSISDFCLLPCPIYKANLWFNMLLCYIHLRLV